MTTTSITTPTSNPSTLTLDDWLHEIEVAGAQTMPTHQLEDLLAIAPLAVIETRDYAYWKGVLDAHQIHLHWGGVAA